MDKANRIFTEDWYTHTRQWEENNYFDAAATIEPSYARASSAHPWDIVVDLGTDDLSIGDHIAVELPVTWQPDMGRPYLYGRQLLSKEWKPGYAATPKFILPQGVGVDFDVTPHHQMNRYIILDILLTQGAIGSGESFHILLANPEGTLIRCQWYAQNTPIAIAVRKKGEKFYRRIKKIPEVMVIGLSPAMWKIAARSSGDRRRFTAKIVAVDNVNQNPVIVSIPPHLLDLEGISFGTLQEEKGYYDVPKWIIKDGKIDKQKSPSQSVIRVEALNRDAGLYGRSNPIPTALADQTQVYFGDLHGQSNRSVGFGTEREYFWWARDGEFLDFAAPANHYGGREILTNDLWESTIELCDEFNKQDDFVTLYGYEWGSHKDGHRNVYYAEKPGAIYIYHGEEGVKSVQRLWELLQNQMLDAITVPHHTKFIAGISWNHYQPIFQRLAEVCSCWGNSEKNGYFSVQNGLFMGHRLGVVGGTDTHFSQPGRPCLGPFDLGGLTAVICSRLERRSLWQALYSRNCYATTGDRILLNFTINGFMMGTQISLEENRVRQIEGRAIGTDEIDTLEIVRNNEVWKEIPCSGKSDMEFFFIDRQNFGEIALVPQIPIGQRFVFYYMRIHQKNRHWAMSSPIWIEEKLEYNNCE